MSFNISKSKKDLDKVDKHFDYFQKDFSEEQKMAVLWRLCNLAKSDGEIDKKESIFLIKIAEIISTGKLNNNETPLNFSEFDLPSDSKTDKKETEFLKKIVKILNLSEEKLKDYLSHDRRSNADLLAGLNQEQKEWLLITLFGMIYSDGKVLKEEYDEIKELVIDIKLSSTPNDNLHQVEKVIQEKYDILKQLHCYMFN